MSFQQQQQTLGAGPRLVGSANLPANQAPRAGAGTRTLFAQQVRAAQQQVAQQAALIGAHENKHAQYNLASQRAISASHLSKSSTPADHRGRILNSGGNQFRHHELERSSIHAQVAANTYCSGCGSPGGYDGPCGSCGCQQTCIIRPDDGSRYDQVVLTFQSVGGYVFATPNPVPLPIAQTQSATDPDQFQLAPVFPYTMTQLQNDFGFTADTKPDDVFFIAGYDAPNQALNSMYYITAVPSVSSPYYVIQRMRSVTGNGCGIDVGDFIWNHGGNFSGVWEVVALQTDVTPNGFEVEATNLGDLNAYCPEVAIPPRQC